MTAKGSMLPWKQHTNLNISQTKGSKNFFAFKLHEQAVPSRFLLASASNYRTSSEAFSRRYHSRPSILSFLQPREHMDTETSSDVEQIMVPSPAAAWAPIAGSNYVQILDDNSAVSLIYWTSCPHQIGHQWGKKCRTWRRSTELPKRSRWYCFFGNFGGLLLELLGILSVYHSTSNLFILGCITVAKRWPRNIAGGSTPSQHW